MAGYQTITDDSVGVTVELPKNYQIKKDPVLFDTHGFLVVAPGDDDGDEVARIALAYQAKPADLDSLVQAKLDQYKELSPTRTELTLPDGRSAIAVTGLPGTHGYSVVYAADGDRVYEIGLWSVDGTIDDRGRDILAHIKFEHPARTIGSLGLRRAQDALYDAPPVELAARNALAHTDRVAAYKAALAADPQLAYAAQHETTDAPVRTTPPGTAAAGCGFTAPSSLYWQLQWDGSNTFYSGSWYSLRNESGWSAMSGNYGSWWGTNFHVGLCYPYHLNQYYANDWPTQYWGNAYAAFSGYVEWAAWGTDGFASLGRYVVVRNGQYRSLTAHLLAIESGIYWGAWVDAYSTIIGYAGDTGEYYANDDWAPHIHARVAWGESLTWNGQPYGGQSVGPNALRSFRCTDCDVDAAGSGGWYTSFYHGRWMKY
ncbi:MAG TPA: M23 family metallopeptidase [Kofleriaceae bacterium]|nr:M23 family metallopeptidase [Kofleriaceae bacterium]